MNYYLLTNGGFTFVPEHDNPVAVQDNPITKDYLVDAMSTYLENFGPPLAASATAAPAVAAVDPDPTAINDPPVVATVGSLRQLSLSNFWSTP